MEFSAVLRNYPADPLASKAAFAVGEYHFLRRDFRGAEQFFTRLRPDAPDLKKPADIVGLAYLSLCAQRLGDTERSRALESALKQLLSSGSYLSVFDKNRPREWVSPLGNRFKLRETVDRLEIFSNDKPFYTVELP